MAANYLQEGSPFNNWIISSLLLIDSLGNTMDLIRFLAGDVKIVPAKPQRSPVKVRGKTIASLKGEEAEGSIEIPLHLVALISVNGTGNPTLTQILGQVGAGTAFVPFTTISGTDPDGAVDSVIIDPSNRCWLYQMILAPSRGGDTAAIVKEKVSIYAETPPPDPNIANVGAASAHTISGVVARQFSTAITTT